MLANYGFGARLCIEAKLKTYKLTGFGALFIEPNFGFQGPVWLRCTTLASAQFLVTYLIKVLEGGKRPTNRPLSYVTIEGIEGIKLPNQYTNAAKV